MARAHFWRVRVRGAWFGEVSIDGEIAGLRINGVDVGPLIEAELGDPTPWHPLSLPFDEMEPVDGPGYPAARCASGLRRGT